jgi:hypothetical protein
MPLDYNTLTDHAQCDAATAEVDFELRTYSVRDVTNDLAGERSERLQSSIATQLAAVVAKIARAEALLARPELTGLEREDQQDEVEALNVQRKKLLKRARQASGVNEFLADVDEEQIAKQVEVLTAVKAGITQRRAALPA